MPKRAGWVNVDPDHHLVGLKSPIYVKRWGYKVDRQTILDRMFEVAQKAEGTPVDVWKQGRDRDKPHLFIAQYHPAFRKFRDTLGSQLGEILKMISWPTRAHRKPIWALEGGDPDAGLVYDIQWKVVEEYVQRIIRQRLGRKQERKLWTASFLETHPKTVKDKLWRAPWRVLYKRVVQTGMYYPACGGGGYDGDYDWEPAGLANAKSHVLYWLERVHAPGILSFNRGEYELDGAFIVERENTFNWSAERAAEVLMGATQ